MVIRHTAAARPPRPLHRPRMPGAHPATLAHRRPDPWTSATHQQGERAWRYIGGDGWRRSPRRARSPWRRAAGGDDETAAEQFEDALGELGETSESIEEEVPEPKEPELTLVDLDLPRETTYLGATWTVDEVSYRSAGVDELGVETGPAAVVGYTVANTGEGVLDLPMTAERLSLLDGDDFAIPADTTSAGNGECWSSGLVELEEAIFLLDAGISADDLADYTFRVGVEGNVPLSVPLAGDATGRLPLPLDIPVTVDGELIGGSGTLRAIEAEVLLDYGEERADEDTRFLALTGEVHITESGAGGTVHQRG